MFLSDNFHQTSGRLFERFTGDVCSNCYHWSHPETLSLSAVVSPKYEYD